MKIFIRTLALVLASLLTLVVIWLAAVFAPSFIQPLYLDKLLYELPANYRGWVVYEVGNPRCSPLMHRGRSFVYFVDAGGHGCTSDEAYTGWRTVKYVHTDTNGVTTNFPDTGWGKGGLIWDEFYRSSDTQKWNVFFVGTEQEFHNVKKLPFD